MNVGFPLGDLLSGAKARVVAALLQSARPYTIRELAEVSGCSHTQAGAVVESLGLAGIVVVERRGNALLVEINDGHLAVSHLRALAALRRELIERMQAAVATWTGITAAWVFGSTARGDGNSSSDVDLLVVFDHADDRDDEIGKLAYDVRRWAGNQLQVVEHTAASWHQMVADRQPIVDSIRRDGIELVTGSASTLKVAS